MLDAADGGGRRVGGRRGLDGRGSDGAMGRGVVAGRRLRAPHLLPVEVAHVLRRAGTSGDISLADASLAHGDLLALRVELLPYAPFGPRIWQLRANLTAYDAWYVAIAEAWGVPLFTLDARLARAPGPRCEVVLPSTGR